MGKEEEGSGRKQLYENGGRDLSPEGWEEMAKLMEGIKERSEDVAKALRQHGRGSEKFNYAKRKWLEAWNFVFSVCNGGPFPN